MKKTLVIATFNPHKAGELLGLLPALPLEYKLLGDFPGAAAAVEDGRTLEENALKKARAAAALSGCWALADDTGLEVYALGGAPGVRSARYAGEGCSPADNNARLLNELLALPADRRGARFACVIALVSPGGTEKTARGVLEGRITAGPRGANGFGYDPLFEVEDSGLTLAEIPAAGKNECSHRARALRAILPELRRLAAGD
ncbi:MAG TPA: non-canonical purine NTP pyrophosphatase [Elusimicrobiales bacterium]|nr:non-canonical purine NTP pyrophosphatase [Elusimicrobiales bacterium]